MKLKKMSGGCRPLRRMPISFEDLLDDVLQEDHRDEFESLDPEHLSRTD
jgi:hypothetical protein